MFRNPTTDLIVILLIVLVIFGPKRLPGLGKQLGQGIREFKDGITGKDKESEEHPALTQTNASPTVSPTPAPTVPAESTVPSQPERQSAEIGTEQRS